MFFTDFNSAIVICVPIPNITSWIIAVSRCLFFMSRPPRVRHRSG